MKVFLSKVLLLEANKGHGQAEFIFLFLVCLKLFEIKGLIGGSVAAALFCFLIFYVLTCRMSHVISGRNFIWPSVSIRHVTRLPVTVLSLPQRRAEA